MIQAVYKAQSDSERLELLQEMCEIVSFTMEEDGQTIDKLHVLNDIVNETIEGLWSGMTQFENMASFAAYYTDLSMLRVSYKGVTEMLNKAGMGDGEAFDAVLSSMVGRAEMIRRLKAAVNAMEIEALNASSPDADFVPEYRGGFKAAS